MAADVWFPETPDDSFKNENEWKTVLLFGQRQGGSNYSALDITDPHNPDFLFNFDTSMSDFGETWSDPVIFKVHKNSFEKKDERFFAFIGGGYWQDSLYDIYTPQASPPPGNSIYALDILNMSSNPAPSLGNDYWYITPSIEYEDSMAWPFPSQPAVMDTNLDSYSDLLLIGDVAGQLWKVNLNGDDSTDVVVNNWESSILFKAPRPTRAAESYLWQPIFFPATSAWDGQRWWIYFGTGDRANAAKEGTENRFYAIIDSNYSEPITEDDLKRVSIEGPFSGADLADGKKGWYVVFTDFDNTDSIGRREGEKTTSSATVLLDTLIFTTFQPHDINNPCLSSNGIARLYKMQYKTGNYANMAPSQIIGRGVPQTPRYTFNLDGDGKKIINLPGEVIIQDTPNIGLRRRLLWWAEVN